MRPDLEVAMGSVQIQRIPERLEAIGLSVGRLAATVGIGEGTLRAWLRGDVAATWALVIQVHEALAQWEAAETEVEAQGVLEILSLYSREALERRCGG